ncbi:MAG: macro domain-containing protein [Actinocrinis sp.]
MRSGQAPGYEGRLRWVLTSPRGRRVLFGNLLAAFGAVSATVQFVGQLFPHAIGAPGPVTAGSLGGCLAWGLARAYPRSKIRREFRFPDTAIVVEQGDLFSSRAHLVVGFSDTFDTVLDDGVVVSDVSVQGQLLGRRYQGDVRRLDDELSVALAGIEPVSTEAARFKPRGKLDRYAVGTVAVLGARPQLVFAVAYSRIGNDYVARSSVEELWYSLNRLWDAVYLHGQLESVAMPLIGSGLCRLDGLDEEGLLRLILLSFAARSRERRICRELRVVVSAAGLRRINLHEVGAFLTTLGS